MIRECAALCREGHKCSRAGIWNLVDGGRVLLRFCSQHAKRVRLLLVKERQQLAYDSGGESPSTSGGNS